MITLSAQIVDQASKSPIGPLTDGLVFKSLPKRKTIEVTVSGGKVACVKMTLNGSTSIERIAPYRFNGDNGEVALPPGDYLFGATAYSDKEGKTPPVASLKLRFGVAKPEPEAARPIIKGIVSGSSKIEKYAPFLKTCNVTHIRTWIDIGDWTRLPVAKDADKYKTAKDLGFKVCAVFQTNKKPRKESIVTDWINRACNIYNGLIDIWEVGNEPNWGDYRMGTLADYYNAYLVPAAKVLRDRKLVICGGSITTNVKDLQVLIDLGYLDHVDYVGFHPYGPDAITQVQRIKDAYAICRGKPILMTEWNIHAKSATGGPNPNKWRDNIGTCWAAAKAYTAGAFYYRSEANDQPAGRQGILTKNSLLPNEPYYSVFRDMRSE